MLLTSSGDISTENILIAFNSLQKDFRPFTLPSCVDFDSVYDQAHPTKCLPRRNSENILDETFYITSFEQSLLNQAKLHKLPKKGDFFSILPYQSIDLESNSVYNHGLTLEIFSIGKNSVGDLMIAVKNIYTKLGIPLKTNLTAFGVIEMFVNEVLVGTITIVKTLHGVSIARATVIREPVLSYAASLS